MISLIFKIEKKNQINIHTHTNKKKKNHYTLQNQVGFSKIILVT